MAPAFLFHREPIVIREVRRQECREHHVVEYAADLVAKIAGLGVWAGFPEPPTGGYVITLPPVNSGDTNNGDDQERFG